MSREAAQVSCSCFGLSAADIALVGSLGHMILDAFQGVLGVSRGAGERVDAAEACKAACGDKELADVTEELLAAQLSRYQAVGFKELIVGCFSEPSTLLLPIVRAARPASS
mmetsp:Transcript_20280/g.65848  ORF Transcript_20280/g.65848 Transcript_20280/m.65848 type:complete len:111 (-) Transcript_20280:594-926(-)